MANSPITRAAVGGHPHCGSVLVTREVTMADYPCDAHRSRYNGPSTRVYLNIYCEEQQMKFKGSICKQCLENLTEDWLSWALYMAPDGWTIPDDQEPKPLETRWTATDGQPQWLNGSKRY